MHDAETGVEKGEELKAQLLKQQLEQMKSIQHSEVVTTAKAFKSYKTTATEAEPKPAVTSEADTEMPEPKPEAETATPAKPEEPGLYDAYW